MPNKIIDIDTYCQKLLANLLSEFGDRVCYLGLQGSYLRGEATENSDLDMMLILDSLTVDDMERYRAVLDAAGESDRACGFICSKVDMKHWNPLEICQLQYTTKDLYGTLTDYLPEWDMEDQVNYVKMSLNNLYHALCHGYIHGERARREAKLLPLYKSAFFILQNIHFLETSRERNGEFVLRKAELVKRLRGEDRQVMETLLRLSSDGDMDYDRDFGLLLHWCQNKMWNTEGE